MGGCIPSGRQLRRGPAKAIARPSPQRAALDHARPGLPGCERGQTRVEPDGVEPHEAPRLAVSIHKCANAPIVEVRRRRPQRRVRVATPAVLSITRWLPKGWRATSSSRRGGLIASVDDGAQRNGAEHVSGIAIPGLPNLHCQAFQRAMACAAEQPRSTGLQLLDLAEVMYRFLARLTPDDVEAIAAFAYMEMLESGFTAVGEFHYLHHDLDGRPTPTSARWRHASSQPRRSTASA